MKRIVLLLLTTGLLVVPIAAFGQVEEAVPPAIIGPVQPDAPESPTSTAEPQEQKDKSLPDQASDNALKEKEPKEPKTSDSPLPESDPKDKKAGEEIAPAEFQTMAEEPTPAPVIPVPPKPVQSDPAKFLHGFAGEFDTDLFTGSATYAFPLALPTGRGKATPALSLNYSSSSLNAQSLVGYGWSLAGNAIFRSTAHGVDKLYNREDFVADIFGNYAELIVSDTANKVYGTKSESSFTEYDFNPSTNSWLARDREGTKYYFGQTAASRQADPNNTSRVYKWLLDKVENLNGNTIIFTYIQDSSQVYPDTIRYSGAGSNPGNYEIRFLRESRTPFLSYETGFGVTTKQRVAAIEVYSHHAGNPVLARRYSLGYTSSGVIDLLRSVTIAGGQESMPPVRFDYVDNTEALPDGTPIQKKHLLKKITLPAGGSISLLYQPSTAYRTAGNLLANSRLPFITPTLFKTTVTEPVTGLIASTTYEYAGGHFFFDPQDAFTRQYAGFATVKATDPAGHITVTRFHQSQFAHDNGDSVPLGEHDDHIAKKGRIWRQEEYDSTGVLYAVDINTWDKTALNDADPVDERYFVSLSRAVGIAFDGKSSGKASAQEYTYDTATGNLLTQVDRGEVVLTASSIDGGGKYAGNGSYTDTGTDALTTTIEYALNTDLHLLSLPKRSETKDQQNVVIAEQKISYDGLAYGSAPTKGNATKTETLKSAGQYVTTQAAYNSYGLPTSITNARNNATTIIYDSLNLFPVSVTNPKGHLTTYAYDYLFGTPTESTDSNGFKTKSTYDGLGRLIKTEVSDPASPATLLTTAGFAYDLAASPVSVTATAYPQNTDTGGNAIAITTKTYFDGLGRPLQARTEAEGADKFLVSGTVYDGRGNVKKQLLPQFSAGTAFDPAFNESKPGALSAYDALGRVISTTVPFGAATATATTSYDRWNKTDTDARGFKKDFVSDARGNLIQVKEYLTDGAGSSPAGTTSYQYNGNNNLIQITDALGNIKTFAYDLLGRKLAEDDFHAPADTTYSHWVYSYDNNGNLTGVTDAKNQTTTFTYDELDRPLTEDFSGQTGTEVTYLYDTAPNGKGRLTSVATKQNNQPVITKAFEYDLLGRVSKETRTINALSYVTDTAYDLAGNPKRITYPDAARTEALYHYNHAGQLEKVQKKAGETVTDLVTNLDYAETGAPTVIAYANGVVTTQTYDITYNYFLTDKETAKGATKLQDITYSFDPTGNITGLTDTSATQAAKTAAYTYDGLSRLTAATITNAANSQNYSHTFAYDILGNITTKSDVGAYAYAQTNYANPHAVTQAGTMTYAYDQNGNLNSDGIWTHAWDYKDRLLTSSKTGATINYTYDEAGTRVTKTNTTSGKTTTYISDLLDLEADTEKLAFYANGLKLATLEQAGTPSTPECTIPATGDWTVTADCTISSFKTVSGNITINPAVTLTISPTGVLTLDLTTKHLLVKDTAKLIIKQGGVIAQTGAISSPLPGGTQGGLVFHHPDHLSSASIDTDESGTIVQLTDYYPFGDSRIEETTTAFHNDYTYTGKERDEDTELLYYEARYYDSHLGRFLSLDPWGGDIKDPQSFNKYAYVRNNPLKYVDPDGKKISQGNREKAHKRTSALINSKGYRRMLEKNGNSKGLDVLFKFSTRLAAQYGEYDQGLSREKFIQENTIDNLQIFADAVTISNPLSLDSGKEQDIRMANLPNGLSGKFDGSYGHTDKLQHFAQSALLSAKHGESGADSVGLLFEFGQAFTEAPKALTGTLMGKEAQTSGGDPLDIQANRLGQKFGQTFFGEYGGYDSSAPISSFLKRYENIAKLLSP